MMLKSFAVEADQNLEVVARTPVRHGGHASPAGLQVRLGHPQEGLSFQSCCPADRATDG